MRYEVGTVINDTLVLGGSVVSTRDKDRAYKIAELLNLCAGEMPPMRNRISYHVSKFGD